MEKRPIIFFSIILLIGLHLLVGSISQANSKSYNDRGYPDHYSIIVGSQTIGLGDDESRIKELLGEPLAEKVRKTKPGNYLNPHGTYFKEILYDGLQLNLFKIKGVDKFYYICGITIKNANYVTVDGIKIGSPVEDLKKIFQGNCVVDNNEQVVFEELDSGAEFAITDGKVSKIIFYVILYP